MKNHNLKLLHPAIEITPNNQPIEKIEVVIYDSKLEITLKIMKNNTGSFKTNEDREHGWMLICYPIKMLSGTDVEVSNKKYNIASGIQRIFTNTSYTTAKPKKDKDKVVFRDILKILVFFAHKPTKRRMSGRHKFIKNNLDSGVRRFLVLDTKLNGKRVEKIYTPSNINDMYTKLEVSLGLNYQAIPKFSQKLVIYLKKDAKEEKYKTNNNIGKLLMNFKHNNWSFQVKY